MSQLYFKESQRFNQPWIWVINLFSAGIIIFLLVMQFIVHKPVSDGSAPIFIIILVSLIFVGVIALLWFIRLETEIRRDGIYFRYPPFIRRMRIYRWEDISRCYVRKYNPIWEYGGWGYRTAGKKAGTAFNVSGNMGLQLEFNNGKKILLGTKRPDEIREALKKAGITGSK